MLRQAGAVVPESFDDYSKAINTTCNKVADTLHSNNNGQSSSEKTPRLPENYDELKKQGKVRKATHFVSTISDERSGELYYGNEKMLDIISDGKGIGYLIGKLWFKKNLPNWATHFLEMMIIISADHGPAVAGAHNAIVTARAGKVMLSSLVSGLLTIEPRFGGALNDAGKYFFEAQQKQRTPVDFIITMKKMGKPIPGIGHKIYSQYSPDTRSQTIQQYARKHFAHTKTLDYALHVESLTVQKRSNLILNVDGAMASCLIDMMYSIPEFTTEDIADIIYSDQLNAIFVLARTIGFIGHIFDQDRLKQPLYRHPWDDIHYQVR